MSAPKVYGLILLLTIATAAGVQTASSAGRPPATVTVAAAEETWTIPGAGRTPGQNNTFFVSDLALTNLGDATANVTITFVGPGSLEPKPVTIAPGATTAYRDILNALWSATGLVGALSVESDEPLVLRARTYNTAATGTFGVALPVFKSGDLLGEGGIADSIWVQQSPSASSGFRTNVGVVFPDADGGEAVVTFYDAAGVEVGALTYLSASAGFQQQSSALVLPTGLPVGRAQISVTRGRAAGYAVGVDNVTGDTSLYPFEALPAGVQDVVVSGVARLSGRNNTFFRTDARFYNPTPDEATVTASFHAVGASNPTPPSATVTVPAGRLVEVVDVLDSILHLPVGSGGAVRFTSDQAVAILARTSNIDPQGIQPGTFGAQQRAVVLDSYLSSADAGAVVTAIRQDASFRTNIGFAAGPAGAAYNLTLRNVQGGAVAVTTGTLGTFGWAQPSIADLFPGTTIPADATLLVQVTSGTIDVYDASLDNSSGDLVVTPIAPVPAAIPSSASIGPAGGSIRSEDGRLTLKVPSGALATPTTLSISPIENTAPNAIGAAYSLTPVGLAFARPAQLVLNYSDEDLAGTGAGALGLASQDGATWYGILGGSIDPVARTLFVSVTSTSPAPASALQGSVLQRVAQTGVVGPYTSIFINPPLSLVLTDQSTFVEMLLVGPSSTSSATPGSIPLVRQPPNAVGTWYVNGVSGGNATQGLLFATGNTAAYRAPHCVPRSNPVLIGAFVRYMFGGQQIVAYATGAQVRVVGRDWRIEVTYRSQSLCGFSAAWSLDYSRSHDGAFSLDNDFRVIDFLVGLTRSSTTTPAWCPGFGEGCNQPALVDPIGDLNVGDVTGRLIDTLQGPAFDLTVTAQVPGKGAQITFTCGTPAQRVTEPVFHGSIPDPAVQQFIVTFPSLEETLQFVYPGGIESAIVKLTPIRPPGCP